MVAAYGDLKPSSFVLDPLRIPLATNGRVVVIEEMKEAHFAKVQEMLNSEISNGNTYPLENKMDLNQFQDYFKKGFVGILDDKVVGAFYIKPNYPGRCSHICNGGFLVTSESRGLGIGFALGSAFLKIAPLMGFKASVFNLVFENNTHSISLWKKLGFEVIGKVPKAGRLAGSEDLVDALVFYKNFDNK
jgi:ribosomal protein S18 acetylase RimI-like enzyme